MRDRRNGVSVVYRSLSRWDLDLILECNARALITLWLRSAYAVFACFIFGIGWPVMVVIIGFAVVRTRMLVDLGKTPYGYELQQAARRVEPVLRRGGRAFASPPPDFRNA